MHWNFKKTILEQIGCDIRECYVAVMRKDGIYEINGVNVYEALEKQIPKNWIAEDIGDGEYGWKCPSCKSVFVLMDGTPQDNEYNYCPNCGQSMAERKGDAV